MIDIARAIDLFDPVKRRGQPTFTRSTDPKRALTDAEIKATLFWFYRDEAERRR